MFQIALKKLRESKGISQRKLAEELGLSQSTVGMWESGKNRPEYSNLIKLAEIFGVSVNELTENEYSEEVIAKELHNNSDYVDSNKIYKKLVEIGLLKEGEPITEKHLEVLAEILAPQLEFIRFKLNQKQ